MQKRNPFKFGLMEGKVHHKDGETECVIVLIGRGKVDEKNRETEPAKVWIDKGKRDQKDREMRPVQIWIDGRKSSLERWRDGTP